MSTSRVEAENDLLTQMPSCSYELPLRIEQSQAEEPSPVYLCDDVLIEIFRQAVRSSALREQLTLKRVSSLAYSVVRREMSRNDHLEIEIREPSEFRYVGFRKEKLQQPEPHIIVQGSTAHSLEEALEMTRTAVSSMGVVRNLRIFCRDPDTKIFETIVNELIAKENIRLETIQLRRKRGGAAMRCVVDLIAKHAETLKVLGQIGLSEAAQCFSDKLHLNRLHLNTFDLGFISDAETVCSEMLILISSGATAQHLSYSSFEGFDPTEDVVQRFLTALDCTSMRLTMMKGPYVPPQPDYMIGKVRRVEHIEMVEVVEKTNIFNTLVTHEKVFKKVFPNVADINYLQDWKN